MCIFRREKIVLVEDNLSPQKPAARIASGMADA